MTECLPSGLRTRQEEIKWIYTVKEGKQNCLFTDMIIYVENPKF